MLHCLVGNNIKSWDLVFCKAKFVHNHVVNQNTKFSPIRVVYEMIPRGPVDLGVAPDASRDHAHVVDFVPALSSIHTQVHQNLQVSSAKYKAAANCLCRNV